MITTSKITTFGGSLYILIPHQTSKIGRFKVGDMVEINITKLRVDEDGNIIRPEYVEKKRSVGRPPNVIGEPYNPDKPRSSNDYNIPNEPIEYDNTQYEEEIFKPIVKEDINDTDINTMIEIKEK